MEMITQDINFEETNTQPCKDPPFPPSSYPPPPITPAFEFSTIDINDPYYEVTQPNDEVITRLANGNSGLTDEDAADIVCILHPDSDAARVACSENHKLNPKNTISLYGDTADLASQGLVPCDLAVRLSANVKDINLGWVFGRSHERCDFVFKAGTPPQISNQHFRIYLNEHSILMIEDMSTNGISVDRVVLRYKRKDNGKPYRHTIGNGTLLSVVLSRDKSLLQNFIIRVPQRSDEAQEAFDKNFANYVFRMQEHQVRHCVAVVGNRTPLNLFPNAANRGASSSSLIRKAREWKGGPKYNKINVIGKGAFAVVYKLTDKRSGTPFAAKELEKKKFMRNGVQKINTEIKIMSKIHHENVVSFVECVDWGDYLYIVMEYVPEGDLTGLINACHHLPEDQVREMTLQLLSALKYLHSLNVTHRDIKPDNILCQSRDPIHVKLTDFGLSKMIDNEDTFLHTFCGTLLYCAPEVYNEYPQYDRRGRRANRRFDSTKLQQRYDHAVDIWSLAGVLFYSFCGTPPFPVGGTSHHTQLLERIMTVPLDVRPLQHAKVSDYGISFVVKMLHTDPEHRATIEELEQMPWLTKKKPVLDETEDEIIEELDLPASQLSLADDPECENSDTNEEEDDDFGTETIHFQPRQIPSSFSTNESNDERSVEVESSISSNFGANSLSAEDLVGEESYEFIRTPTNNGRLFGEVSALRSSTRQVPKQNNVQPVAKFKARLEAASAMPKIPPPPPPPTHPRFATPAARHSENGAVPDFSSLMGAVSQLGHLQMDSPSISPTETSAPKLLASSHAANSSLRRPREEINDWYPNDLPPQKRQKSTRVIDVWLPPQTFWDPRDQSTHHGNYPCMLATEYHRFVALAQARGEKFQHGCTTFDHMMDSFRSNSKTPSMETSASFRAQSEPLAEETQNHPRLARDERRLSDDASIQQSIASRDKFPITTNALSLSSTVKTGTMMGNAMAVTSVEAQMNGTSTATPNINSAASNDFQVPKRILAKFSATPDSYVPTLAFNVTEPFTSWGRGLGNTIRYTATANDRVGVPRYAIKLLLFKNDFYSSDGNYTEEWTKAGGTEEGFRFLIATKATAGLTINGTKLPSHNTEDPRTESKYWGEIRNGDIITLSVKSTLLLKLKFECFWGMGKYRRKESRFFLYKELDHITTIDRVCTQLETAARDKRAEDKIEQEKLATEIKRQRTQSVGL